MPQIINPFDEVPGFELADLTTSLNLLPNTYGRVTELGLFKGDGITTTTAILDIADGVLNLLPSVPRGGPATVANRDSRSMRSFMIPHFPHNDVITPDDLQGIRAMGTQQQVETLTSVMTKRQMRMRMKHSQTGEWMRLGALKGLVRDGAGVTVLDLFAEWNIVKKQVDFALGTTTTDIGAKCREVLRHVKKNLRGESMNGVHALVSPAFWDKFINHPSVVKAYEGYNDRRAQYPLTEDVRDGFRHHGITWEEYDATWTLSTGASADAFASGYGMAFPMGTTDTFQEFWAPANWMETVNTVGLQFYARQKTRDDGTGIDLMTQSNPLPIVRRPTLLVEVYTSN